VWKAFRNSVLCIGALALAGGGALLLSRPADAESLDPTLPQRRVVGAPAGASPMSRINGARTGRTAAALPEKPRILWRTRVTGGISLAPAVDERGRVVIASGNGQILQFDERGKSLSSVKTGSDLPVLGPVLSSDGTRVLVTSAPELYGITPSGSVRYHYTLPVGSAGDVPPLAASDGGIVVAAAGNLFRFDASGSLQARASYTGIAAAILERASHVLLVLDRGEVYEWKPPASPNKLASFGGRIDEGAALSGPERVTAVVDHQRLCDVDLKTATRTVRVDSADAVQGPPTLLTSGETRIVTFSGLMLGHDRSGNETTRIALEPSIVGTDGGLVGFTPAPGLIADAQGRIGYVRPGLEAGVVLPNGNLVSASGAACGDPLSLTPAGPKRMLLACRSGLVFMLGDK
jgi:hypothetical protein